MSRAAAGGVSVGPMMVLCDWVCGARGWRPSGVTAVVVFAAWALAGQDEVVVESQRPERVPFDLAAELYLQFDAVVVACRKAMRQPALATTDAMGHLAGTHSS